MALSSRYPLKRSITLILLHILDAISTYFGLEHNENVEANLVGAMLISVGWGYMILFKCLCLTLVFLLAHWLIKRGLAKALGWTLNALIIIGLLVVSNNFFMAMHP